MPENVNKGRALLRISEMLGIPAGEIIAIGDSDNDASMLRASGMPVAMGNADDELKKLAKYITSGCDHDGAARAIYHLCI